MNEYDMYCPHIYLFNNKDGVFNFWKYRCIERQEDCAVVCRECIYGKLIYKEVTGRELLLAGGYSHICKCGKVSMELNSVRSLYISEYPICEDCVAKILEKRNNSKPLTPEQKEELYNLYINEGYSQVKLGLLFKKSQFTISYIIKEMKEKL